MGAIPHFFDISHVCFLFNYFNIIYSLINIYFRTLYFASGKEFKSTVFVAAFILPWIGAVLVTLNSVLLGGTMSFFQSVCLLGYCIFPLTIAAIATRFWNNIIFKGVLTLVCFIWSTLCKLFNNTNYILIFYIFFSLKHLLVFLLVLYPQIEKLLRYTRSS